jgi:HNH endonuclease
VPRCIYCLEAKLPAEFNREHVIPESCGRFRDTLVAHELVCAACNSHFGQTLDLTLARGTDEGLQRYLYGVKPKEEVERFRYDALTIHYQGEGDYHGAILRLTADPSAPNGFRAVPIDQIGFAMADGSGFEWMPLKEAYSGAWKERVDLDPRRGVRIYAEDHQAVREYLKAEGVDLPTWRQMVRPGDPNDEVLVQQVSRVTTDVERAIAKIAFNYLAVSNGAEFALRPEFDRIRRFIRLGEKQSEGFIHVDADDILPLPRPPGTPEDHRPVVHIVTVEYSLHETSAIGQVSLFGGLRYVVCHAESPVPGLSRSGHLYNVADLSVARLGNKDDGLDRKSL